MDIVSKIEAFVKKYYLNRLIQGLIFGAVLLIAIFLFVNGVEFLSWLPRKGRFILFLLFVLSSLFVLILYFFVPLVNLVRYRKKMTDKQAAVLIGKFFPDIRDKLLNTLQLSDDLKDNADNELLVATIEQRIKNMSAVRFTDAVNLKDNYKYLKIFALAFIVLVVLVVFVPDFSRKPVERVFNYSTEYHKPLPYSVSLPSLDIEALQGDDVEYSITVEGEKIPESFYVKSDAGVRLMNRLSVNEFCYVFKNVNHSERFYIEGGEFTSPEIEIVVRPNPVLLYYETAFHYPKYIKRRNDTVAGKTRFMVPLGTDVEMFFHTRDVDSLVVIRDSLVLDIPFSDGMFSYSFKAVKSGKFYVSVFNDWNNDSSPVPFAVDVIPDAFPEIQVQEFHEEFTKEHYYSGLIADDYGFSRLEFHFDVENKPEQSFKVSIPVDKRELRTSFYYSVDLDTVTVFPGDEIDAYFEVWDNDGINGPKSRRSEVFMLSLPSLALLDSVANASEEQVMDKMKQKSEELESLQKEIEDMLKDLVSKKELNWSDKEKMKELLEKQQQLQEEWENVKEEQKKLSDFLKDNELTSQELLEKQEQINKLFEEVIPDEMKQLMEEIEELLNEMPRDKMQEMMKELKKNSKELKDMMDRNLSLLEQLKVEKDMNDFIEDLKELADKLMNEGDGNTDSLSASDAKKEFDELQKQLDSIMKNNKQLPNPFDINKDEEMIEDINEDLDSAEESENNGDQNKSSEQKKNAGQKMQKMADSMQMNLGSSSMERKGEDAHLVRILLENVVRSSHSEEELLLSIGMMKPDDPTITEKISRQKEISDNFVMVEDSLRNLAMRQPEVKNFVFNELDIINQQLGASMKDMRSFNYNIAVQKQQTAMMSMNNLALMLAESLEDMESAMGGSSSSCSQPKQSGSQPNSSDQNIKNMKDLQEQIGKSLEQLREQIKGEQNGQPMPSSMSEQLARLAAQQEMIREGMRQMLEEMKKNGVLGDDGINEIIKEMEKLEEDIVNKRITNQSLERNRDIMSRMLKAENAQQEREKDEKRKSDEFKGKLERRTVDELDYKEKMMKQQEFLKMNPIEFQPFYKDKINEYFFRKNSNQNN